MLSYMLKVACEGEMMMEFMKQHNMFEAEAYMYHTVIPEMEQLYKNAGLDVRFGAKSYKLCTDSNYILLEDLRPYGFKNTNRLDGLDLNHSKQVLKKLAQWHAASATRVATKGDYPQILTEGLYKESGKPMMDQMFLSAMPSIEKSIKLYKGHEEYEQQVLKFLPKLVDELFKAAKIEPSDFNVLNHGDCWSNNVMFKYKENGEIDCTYLVDYQMCKYGNPAQDLYYFLLSSTKLDLKINQFDVLIKYYYDELLQHLMLLKYPKKLPLLREIHMDLFKYSVWGKMCIFMNYFKLCDFIFCIFQPYKLYLVLCVQFYWIPMKKQILIISYMMKIFKCKCTQMIDIVRI